jgi:hydrogenase nickel incorporation protein HypA/HybF
MSLMEGVLELIEDSARAEGFQQVKKVVLRIGRLSGVEPEAMKFCFDAIMTGTPAEGAELEIIDVPGAGFCPDCERTVELETRFDPCPHCGRVQLPVTAGTEMRVEALDVI